MDSSQLQVRGIRQFIMTPRRTELKAVERMSASVADSHLKSVFSHSNLTMGVVYIYLSVDDMIIAAKASDETLTVKEIIIHC
ncbi:hypothetical protein Plhal304r1_c010g0039301 [Plasmopara halstedii]